MSEEVKKKGFFKRLFSSREEEPKELSGDEEAGELQEASEDSATGEPPLFEEEAGDEEPEALALEEATGDETSSENHPKADEPERDEEVEEEFTAAPKEGGGLFGRLRAGLSKTRGGLVSSLDRALFGKKIVDEETLEELEEALVTADIGVATSMKLVEEVTERVKRRELTDPQVLREYLRERIGEILREGTAHFEVGETRPHVILVVGVNGVGKTTTIGKMAARYVGEGKKVVVGAADTFRAAAIEQLAVWGERVGAKVVKHEQGSDPAAVAYDTLEAAKARGADVVIIDTAGRLHNKANLMAEMEKIHRVLGKAVEGAPHETILVLDATTGQNAINQAKQFKDSIGVDFIALTKLDGTAKGGVIVGICDELEIPVKFIGIGEKVDDLRPFVAGEFVKALF
ncbi:MAG: signal recognition particle-docking protein FtsY [Deltaproteobacteria bacterium]|nr:MAG: signal recognition particle-docking protein FtsY [Deltaproteobacteria bacterium]